MWSAVRCLATGWRAGSSAGDEATQDLADSIRADEQQMLDRILKEIPKLTEAVVRSEIRGNPSYDISKTGAADAAPLGVGEREGGCS